MQVIHLRFHCLKCQCANLRSVAHKLSNLFNQDFRCANSPLTVSIAIKFDVSSSATWVNNSQRLASVHGDSSGRGSSIRSERTLVVNCILKGVTMKEQSAIDRLSRNPTSECVQQPISAMKMHTIVESNCCITKTNARKRFMAFSSSLRSIHWHIKSRQHLDHWKWFKSDFKKDGRRSEK